MLNPIKLTVPDDLLFFWSDMHIHHAKPFLLGPRGFNSVEEHDAALVCRWNETVNDAGTIFHLGDLLIASDAKQFWELLRQLRFAHLYLLLGNHPSGQKQAYRECLKALHPIFVNRDGTTNAEVYPLTWRLDGARPVTFLPQYVEAEVKSHDGRANLVLQHYPIIVHNDMGKRSIHLCGHSHASLPLTARTTGRGLRLDCGVESVSHPISLAEVKRLMKSRDIDAWDRHGREEPL